jgi:hypothetical protein
MPWEIRTEGGEFCVYQSDTDERVTCHPTRPEAEAHMRALYANVDEDFGMVVDRSFFLDLLSEDAAIGMAAQRALAGEPITIIPQGIFWRDGVNRHVDDQVVEQFVENWRHRLDRGLRRNRLAVDADHNGRALGWYKDVMALDSGVGATFSWNRAGRQALEESEFSYFSPSVYWQMRDRVTNEWVHNVVAGGALTNYPFFGEQTALYSLQAINPGGAPIFYAVTKTGPHGDQLPSRAYLVVEDADKPSTWHLPIMSWRGGQLVNDHKLMGGAKAALTASEGHRGNRYEGPQQAEALARLKRVYKSEGLEFNLEGGSAMSQTAPIPDGANADQVVSGLQRFFALFARSGGESPPTPPVPGPDVAALEARVAALTAQVETFGDLPARLQTAQTEAEEYRQRVAALEGDLGSEREARMREHFTQEAQGFAHLPCQTDNLADHLRWLYAQDTGEGQPHAAFFGQLLRSADSAFSDAFRQAGSAQPSAGSALARINAAVNEYRQAHPDVDYETALAEVVRVQPELYRMYEADRQATARQGGVS